MCSRSTCSDSNASSHILQLAKREKNRIKSDMENKFLTKKPEWASWIIVLYLRIQLGCEHSQCGTAAGTGSCTVGSSGGRLCGFPSSRCSAFPAPSGVSYGSWTCSEEWKHTEMSTNSLACGSLWTISQLLTVIKNRLLTFIWTDDSGLSKDLETTQNRLLRKIGVPNWFANSWSQRCILSDCFGC